MGLFDKLKNVLFEEEEVEILLKKLIENQYIMVVYIQFLEMII